MWHLALANQREHASKLWALFELEVKGLGVRTSCRPSWESNIRSRKVVLGAGVTVPVLLHHSTSPDEKHDSSGAYDWMSSE